MLNTVYEKTCIASSYSYLTISTIRTTEFAEWKIYTARTQSHLIPQAKWVPFPKLNDRNGWSKADPEMMKAFLKAAEPNINYVWPYIPATKSSLIQRTGDREEVVLETDIINPSTLPLRSTLRISFSRL